MQAQAWPVADLELLAEDEVEVAIQVNGKYRGSIRVPVNLSEEELVERCLALPVIAAQIDRNHVEKVISVPGRIINLVRRKG